ncbi:MAG: PAS domain S-box protein, partial [Candidatus Thorarchaeota archaeon]|nr:PAS domain S-box protein [Candidatus Thorarchaeota archaeon]
MDDLAEQEVCRTILHSAPTLIVAANRDGIIQEINRDAFGPRESSIGRSIYEFMPKEFHNILREKVNFVFDSKAPTEFLFKDSSEKWFRMRLGPAITNDEVSLAILTANDITDQKEAEDRLRDSEAKLRSLFNTTLEGIILSDETGNIIEWNKAQEDMFGIAREKALGQKLWDVQYDLFPAEKKTQESYERLKGSMSAYFETGIAPWLGQVAEANVQMGSGEMGIIQQFSAPIKTSRGYALCAFIQDVTNRRKAERAREVSERRFRSLFEESNDAVVILDLEGRHLDFNKRFEELLGYSREELLNTTSEFTVAEEEKQDSKQRLRDLLEGKTLPIYERKFRRKDGSEVPAEINISLIRDEENNPLHIQSIIRDISSRKESARALEESEEKYRTLVENMQYGIVILQEGRIVFTNDALAAIVGYTVDDIQGMLMIDLIAAEDRLIVANRYKRRLSGETIPSEYEIHALHKNGQSVSLRIRGSVIDYQGKPSTIATITDITEQKIAENAVKKERDRAETYLEMAGVMFLALDTEGRITLLNKKGTEVLGYSQEELLGTSWFDLIPQRVREEVRKAFGELIKGESKRIENLERHLQTKSGNERLISWHTTRLMDANGRTIGTISSGEDITEKRAAQIELKASQNMLKLVMNNIPQHIFWKDTSSKYLGCNDSFAEVYISGKPIDIIG